MKQIVIGARTLLTGTEIAEAVVRYGLALARHRQLDMVDIPVSTAGGATERAGFTVGWRADTLTLTTALPAGAEELVEPETVIDLLERADRVGPAQGKAFSAAELTEQWPSFDLDMYAQ